MIEEFRNCKNCGHQIEKHSRFLRGFIWKHNQLAEQIRGDGRTNCFCGCTEPEPGQDCD